MRENTRLITAICLTVASLGLVALVVQEDSSIVIREQPAPVNYAGADKEYPAGFFDEGKNSVGLDKLTGDGKMADQNRDKEYSPADAYLGVQGHYYMGGGRRRVGAGFNKKRPEAPPTPPGKQSQGAELKMLKDANAALNGMEKVTATPEAFHDFNVSPDAVGSTNPLPDESPPDDSYTPPVTADTPPAEEASQTSPPPQDESEPVVQEEAAPVQDEPVDLHELHCEDPEFPHKHASVDVCYSEAGWEAGGKTGSSPCFTQSSPNWCNIPGGAKPGSGCADPPTCSTGGPPGMTEDAADESAAGYGGSHTSLP